MRRNFICDAKWDVRYVMGVACNQKGVRKQQACVANKHVLVIPESVVPIIVADVAAQAKKVITITIRIVLFR